MHIFDNSSVPSYVRSLLIARNNDSPYLFYCIDSKNLRDKVNQHTPTSATRRGGESRRPSNSAP
jgi:hypothetical protein